jgi:hypothetical protein
MDETRRTAREIADDLNSRGGWKKATPRKSQGYMAICPNHNDKNPSLSVRETENGRILLHCFATTCTDDKEVAARVESVLGLDPGALGGPGGEYKIAARHDSVKGARKEFDAIVPVPSDAPAFSSTSRRFRSKTHGYPVKHWTYRDADGRVMGYVARYEKRDENGKIDKMIWPWTFALRDGKREWVVGAMPDPRVPYNLDKIANAPLDAVIQWHEGEKACDAGAEIFPDWIPTTTVGGGSAPHMTDFGAFAGRRVVLFPDADAAGVEYVQLVGMRLLEVGASVRIARFPTTFTVEDGVLVKRPYLMEEGDDMADHRAKGWTTELVREAVSASGLPLTFALDDWEDERLVE